MAKYLCRTCPKCKDYLGVVVPEPPEPVTEVPIDACCLGCGFKLAWKVMLGRNPTIALDHAPKSKSRRNPIMPVTNSELDS